MRVHRLISLALLLALLGLFVGDVHRQALASDTSGGSSDGVIWSGVQSGTPPTSGSSGGSSCTWTLMVTYDANIGHTTNISRVVDGIRYDLYERRCGSTYSSIWIPRLAPSQVARSAALLVQGRLPVPSASFAPSSSSMVVKSPVWFWIDPAWWTPVTATAWIPTVFGPLWARTTATPVKLTFFTQDDGTSTGGDLGFADCIGPGWQWDVTMGDEANSPCMYTFRHASTSRPSGSFVGVIGVEWWISWTSSTGAGGTLPSYTTSSFVVNRVAELQALVG
ncbi:MAG: hypothetical protein LW627_02595 [Ilumatobacteraceae bacterium]|nr:hypothetical protein [Ilumatobacteraceae bacterium]